MKPKGMQGQYAGFASRALAFIIDVVFITATIMIVNWFVGAVSGLLLSDPSECIAQAKRGANVGFICYFQLAVAALFTLVFPSLYLLFFWTFAAGSTPGHAIMGLRIVRVNGHPMRFHVVVRRWLGYIACLFSLGLGFLWVLVDNQRQGWHDAFAGTCVVYTQAVEPNATTLQRLQTRLQPKVHSANISPPLPVIEDGSSDSEPVQTQGV